MSERPSLEAGLADTLRPLVVALVAEEVARVREELREPRAKDLHQPPAIVGRLGGPLR